MNKSFTWFIIGVLVSVAGYGQVPDTGYFVDNHKWDSMTLNAGVTNLSGSAHNAFITIHGGGTLVIPNRLTRITDTEPDFDTVKVTVLAKGQKIDENTWWPLLMNCYLIRKKDFAGLYYRDGNLVPTEPIYANIKFLLMDKKTELKTVLQVFKNE